MNKPSASTRIFFWRQTLPKAWVRIRTVKRQRGLPLAGVHSTRFKAAGAQYAIGPPRLAFTSRSRSTIEGIALAAPGQERSA